MKHDYSTPPELTAFIDDELERKGQKRSGRVLTDVRCALAGW
jgi:hypothetical protein